MFQTAFNNEFKVSSESDMIGNKAEIKQWTCEKEKAYVCMCVCACVCECVYVQSNDKCGVTMRNTWHSKMQS